MSSRTFEPASTRRAYAFNGITNLLNRDLGKGKNKKNEEYDRKFSLQPGYDELIHIVAGLQKDVKKINQCITLDGAKEYASKRKNWTAHEEDITGPHGKPDGINEVFVCDAKGNLKVINGVGLEKSQYPYRKAYRTMKPTKDERKEYPYVRFMNDYSQIHEGFDDKGMPYYEHNMGDDIGDEFRNVQPTITVKALYKQFIFAPVYEEVKAAIKESVGEPMKMAQVYNKALAIAFNRHIKLPVLTQLMGKDPLTAKEKEVNKFMRSVQYKNNLQATISELFSSNESIQICQTEVDQIIGEVVDSIVNVEGNFSVHASPHLPKFTNKYAIPQGAVASPIKRRPRAVPRTPPTPQAESVIAEDVSEPNAKE